MKNLILSTLIACLTVGICTANPTPITPIEIQETTSGEYTLVVEGFDWGAAASKVILSLEDSLSDITSKNFEVHVKRSTECTELKQEEATGKLRVLYSYLSDAKANRVAKGTHLTLVLFVAPFEQMNSPIKYFFGNPKCSGNQWLDFQLTIFNLSLIHI